MPTVLNCFYIVFDENSLKLILVVLAGVVMSPYSRSKMMEIVPDVTGALSSVAPCALIVPRPGDEDPARLASRKIASAEKLRPGRKVSFSLCAPLGTQTS